MASLQSVTKFTNKIVPTSKGIIQNVVTGIGADQTMRLVDNVFGSPVQKIFSFNLPIIGNVGTIDLLNYIALGLEPKTISLNICISFSGEEP